MAPEEPAGDDEDGDSDREWVGAVWGRKHDAGLSAMEVTCPEDVMVDLSGYVIIIVETKDKKIRLYGKTFRVCKKKFLSCKS